MSMEENLLLQATSAYKHCGTGVMWEKLQNNSTESVDTDTIEIKNGMNIVIEDESDSLPVVWYKFDTIPMQYEVAIAQKAGTIAPNNSTLVNLYKITNPSGLIEQFAVSHETRDMCMHNTFRYLCPQYHLPNTVPADSVMHGFLHQDHFGPCIGIFDVSSLDNEILNTTSVFQRAAILHDMLPKHTEVSSNIRVYFQHVGYMNTVVDYVKSNECMRDARVVIIPDTHSNGANNLSTIM